MGLRPTIEVINGEQITRYNGNNPAPTSASRDPAVYAKLASSRVVQITAWRKKKAKEAEYVRRYLSG